MHVINENRLSPRFRSQWYTLFFDSDNFFPDFTVAVLLQKTCFHSEFGRIEFIFESFGPFVGYHMASNEDHPHGDETVGGAEREIKRGITVMKKVIRDRDRGVLIKVHWNEGGQLIEPNGSTLTSFIGALVRNEVPITCDNWRNKQLNEAKDKIWSEIKRCFDIEENRRDHCLKLAGKLLRGFRTFLSTTFLRDTEGTFVDAELPSKYASLISPKEWETFKSKRKTQEFKSVSETNRQRASSPAYPYRKGRVGYGRLEQSILTKENSSETSLPAHVLWKEARVGKDGKIKEDVQQIFEKCETLSQSIVPYEDTDCRSILSRALDVPEYSGRVRGKGFGITQKSLNIKKQKTPSNKELQQTLEALKAEVLELRKERERDRAAGFKDTSDKEDFDQILYHTQLSVGVINTYMRYLYDKLMGPRGLEQRFSFLNPMKTNLTEMIRKPDEVRTYVVERFMADTDREKLFFLPFNTGDSGHWLLVAINPFKEIVYYLDSLHND
ncbi:uncharacterized protein LOC127135795 [Lathyrus oleraceus]|uniref:uncharacterized protein LOC127135795 n=1 Tax=Pisum sativum TaxID=3888 RepID=UPI0021D049F6|nr:uncharacterized protein LOC127135795 [Pisum sativum]